MNIAIGLEENVVRNKLASLHWLRRPESTITMTSTYNTWLQ